MKPALQELLTDGGEYVAPSPKDGQSAKRESRILVRISQEKVELLYKKVGIVFDHAAIPDHDAYALQQRVFLVLDEFFGKRRR